VESNIWLVKTARTPDELEVLLNLLEADGYDIFAIYNNITEWVVICVLDEGSDEDEEEL